MRALRTRRPSLGTGLSVAAIVVAGAGIATAANPSADGTITACVKQGSGVQVVTETNPCEPGETTITFNAPGPRGPTGANGTNGRDGTAGTSCANRSDSLCRGPDASASYSPAQATTTVYRGDHVSIKRDSSESATASCVESESRLSGGYELSDIDSKSTRPLLSIKENMPFGQRGWSVAVRNSSLEKVKLTVFAICGKGN